jgi:hypothetical protein
VGALLAETSLHAETLVMQGDYFTHVAGLLRLLVLQAPAGLRHLASCAFPSSASSPGWMMRHASDRPCWRRSWVGI